MQMVPPEFVRSLAVNFVSLTWNDETQQKYQAASGFVIAVRGAWWFITAGHILGRIERALADGQRLTNFSLDDGWSIDSRHRRSIPFAFERTQIFVLGEDDIDLGVIYLLPYYAEQLAANNVRPMDESVFSAPLPGTFEWYALLGLATQLESRPAKRLSRGRASTFRCVARRRHRPSLRSRLNASTASSSSMIPKGFRTTDHS